MVMIMITMEIKDNWICISDGERSQSSPLTKGIEEKEQYMVSLAAFLGYEPLELLKLDLDENKLLELNMYTEEQDYSQYDHMSLDELTEEREELLGTISNERGFQKGCSDFDNIWMHEYNISALLQKLEYVEERIKIMKSERETGEEDTQKSTLDVKIQSASSRIAGTRIASQVKEKEYDI